MGLLAGSVVADDVGQEPCPEVWFLAQSSGQGPLVRVAGIDGKVGMHTLRHSTATRLLEAGTDVRVVSELLGHSSTGITADVYQHVTPRLRREAADRLEAVLGD